MGKKKEKKADPVAVVEPVEVKIDEVAAAEMQEALAALEKMKERKSELPFSDGKLKAPKYRVHLNCPTPIEFRVLEVEANDEQEAWLKYCEANNIGGSVHERSIELIGD